MDHPILLTLLFVLSTAAFLLAGLRTKCEPVIDGVIGCYAAYLACHHFAMLASKQHLPEAFTTVMLLAFYFAPVIGIFLVIVAASVLSMKLRVSRINGRDVVRWFLLALAVLCIISQANQSYLVP